MKLYTRGGDDGSTGLIGGSRIPKHHPRTCAYGSLDELNCMLGLLRSQISPKVFPDALLYRIQRDLFSMGASLADPRPEALNKELSLLSEGELEAEIDRLTAMAPPLNRFVLPGGTLAAAQAHGARAVCRRAEREVTALREQVPIHPAVLIYLNRLSDLLFALARAENAVAGQEEACW